MLKPTKWLILFSTLTVILPHWAIAKFATGFLATNQLPNSLALLPPPPEFNSVDFLNDQASYQMAMAFHQPERLQQAITDADLSHNNLGTPFSSALGVLINPQNTPITHHLLDRLAGDTERTVNIAKDYYQRIRPFMLFNSQSCTPKEDAGLRKNGSYPSGHTSYGWAIALILAEIRPERQQQLLQRGYQFGQNRVLCRAHWQSDVDAGYIVGAALVARLQANADFSAALANAKQEIAHLVVKP